jgi:hypothetical protein
MLARNGWMMEVGIAAEGGVMADHRNHVLRGIGIGAAPGALLWVIGAVIGGEAMLSFGVIGILVGVVGMIIGGVVGAGAERNAASDSGRSRASMGAVIGCIPGVVLLFVVTRVGLLVMLVGGLIGASIGGRMSAGGRRPNPAH